MKTHGRRIAAGTVIGSILVTVFAAICVLPLLYMLFMSLTQTHTLYIHLNQLEYNLKNYYTIIFKNDFGRSLLNSLIVAVLSCLWTDLVCAMAAYGFEKKPLPGKERLFSAVLATMMVPSQVTLIPLFLIMKQIGWLNTYAGLIIPMAGAFGIFVIRQFLKGVDNVYIEAAQMDGCPELMIFFRVIIPLIQPALVSLTMHYSDLNFMLLGRIAAEQYGAALPRALELAGLTGPDGPRFFPKGEHAQAALAAQGRIAVSSYGNGIEEQMCAERGLAFAGFRSQAAPICGEANDGNCWYAFGGVSGHAGLFAPVSALVGLGQRYLQSGGLLAQAMQDTGNGRGLGFEIDAKFPDGCGHTGFTGPSLWLSPHSGLGMAILANRLAFPGQKQAPDLTEFRRTTHELVLRRQGK